MGNRFSKVYATDFGWARAFLMASTREAHETLLMFFARDGVPPASVCENAKETIQGKFDHKLEDSSSIETVGAIYSLVKC